MLRTCRAVAGRERRSRGEGCLALVTALLWPLFCASRTASGSCSVRALTSFVQGCGEAVQVIPRENTWLRATASVPRHGAPRSPGTLPPGGLRLGPQHQLCRTPSGPWRWPFLLRAPPLPSDWTEGACLIPCQCRVFGTALHKLEGSLRVPPLWRWPAIHRTLSLACSSCQMSRLCC